MEIALFRKLVPGIELTSSVLTFSIFIIVLYSFACNGLYVAMIGIREPPLPMSGLLIELILAVFIFIVLFLDPGNESKQGTVLYLSWLLYAPSALYFSRMDLLLAAGSPVNLSILSSSLPPFAIILAGLILACGQLTVRSLNNMAAARSNLCGRGANKAEVDAALTKNLRFELGLVLASAIAVLATIFIVPVLEPALVGIMRSTEYSYIILGIAAVLVLMISVAAYIRPEIK
jgi:hypothetical protein